MKMWPRTWKKYDTVFVVLCIAVYVTYVACQSDSDGVVKYLYSCPQSFQPIGKKCYHFSNKTTTWRESHYECLSLNGTLAVLSRSHQQNLIRYNLNKNLTGSGGFLYWIDGINDWKQKIWKWGASGKPLKYHDFFNPSYFHKEYEWHCIAIDPSKNNRWSPQKCVEKNRFLCETKTNAYVQFKLYEKKVKGKIDIETCMNVQDLTEKQKRKCNKLLGYTDGKHPNEPAAIVQRPTDRPRSIVSYICPQNMVSLGSKCYSFSQDKVTWSDAHYSCTKNNSRLALIKKRSQDLNLRRFLNGFATKHERWIGGMYDWVSGKWKWALTGEPLQYNGFAKNIIENKTREELTWHTIVMDPKLHNQWNIRKQTEKRHYICQVNGKAVKSLRSPRKRADARIVISNR